jgi:biopolymer transport protein ExbD/biopolymer transport protein TolR
MTSRQLPETPESGVRPEINVTPLVDVVLVLLIIFMVVAPRLEQDVQVNLPGIFNPDPEVPAMADALKVTVARSGEYFIDNERYDLDVAVERLGSAHAADPLRRLILRADQDLPYGDVRELFGATREEGGLPGMALMVGESIATRRPSASQSGDAAG